MFFELFLGLRYLKAKRKQAVISLITLISVLSIMVGVMALVVVLSVMNGFKSDLTSKIMGVQAHLWVLDYEGAFKNYEEVAGIVDKVSGVIASTPFIYSAAMVNHSGNISDAVLRGVDPHSVLKVLSIDSMIKPGSLASLGDRADGLPTIIIGSELSKKINAHTGDILKIVTSLGKGVKTREYKVIGIFDSGMYDYDARMVFISLNEAQDFLELGESVSGLEVKVKDIFRTDIISEAIRAELGYPYWANDWKAMNRNLFSMLKLQKVTFFIILTMIVLVGALNIISTLVMVVMEKTREIAILRTMGASARSIMLIFILQGLLVGVVGTIIGLASGMGICYMLAKYKFITLPSDVYFISTLTVRVESEDVFFVSLVAMVISFLATLYPAWRASKQNPIETLRYE